MLDDTDDYDLPAGFAGAVPEPADAPDGSDGRPADLPHVVAGPGGYPDDPIGQAYERR